ncbi:MAG: RNA polymerase sigma factor [Azospirillaceae bacterium]
MPAPPPDDAFRRQLIDLLPRLRRFAYGLTRSLAEADDLVQSACLRALEKRRQWQAGTRLDSWLFRIVQNLWIDGRRRLRHREEVDPDSLPLGDPSAHRTAEARLTLGAVERLILALPVEQRAVLMLATVEGMSYAETAAILGIPQGTVMSRLSRARLALAAALDETGNAEGATGR